MAHSIGGNGDDRSVKATWYESLKTVLLQLVFQFFKCTEMTVRIYCIYLYFNYAPSLPFFLFASKKRVHCRLVCVLRVTYQMLFCMRKEANLSWLAVKIKI